MAESTAAAPVATPAPAPDGKGKPATAADPSVVPAEASGATEDAAPIDAPKTHTPNKSVKEFAALTRKEREVRAQMAQAKERITRADAIIAAHGSAKQNPDGWLKAAGLTYDDVVNHYAGGGNPPEAMAQAAMDRATAAEQRAEALEKRLTERDERAAVNDYIANIEKAVQTDPDGLELIREQKKFADVYELIDMHFRESGEVLDTLEAARMIEAELFEEESQKAKSLFSLKKIKRHLGLPEDDAQASPAPPIDGPPAKGTKTITNELTASSATPASSKPQTDDEHWAAIVKRARAATKAR